MIMYVFGIKTKIISFGVQLIKCQEELIDTYATKYCNWHNRDAYAIFDSFVEKVLIAYKKQDHFSEFRNSDLKEFSKFKQTIQDFIRFYNLTDYNLKEIDKYLWIYGKEMFPVKY